MPPAIPALSFIRKPEIPDAPVYAVCGGEDFLRRRALELLTKQLSARGLEVRRVREIENIGSLLDELRSPGMFGPGVALVVINAREGNRQEASTRFKEEFAAYIDKPSRRNVLVFEGVTWQRNLTVPKRVEERFPTVMAEELKPWDTRGFDEILGMQAREQGLALAPGAAAALRDTVGGSLARACGEMQKLALLAQGGKVTPDLVAKACGYEGVDVVFPLCDAILTGERVTAQRLAAKIAGKAEIGSVLSFLALVRTQVVTLGRVALAVRGAADPWQALAKAAPRVREAVRAGLLRTAGGLGRVDIARAIDVLLGADEQMKSAAPDPGALLVGVVARLCAILHRARPLTAAAR